VQIKTILIPTDFSANAQAAFATAYDLAQQLGATLHVLHVQDESVLRIALKEGLLEANASDEEIRLEVQKIIEMRFSSMLAGISGSDVKIQHLSRRGDAETEILKYANEIGADMIVLGMRGASALGSLASILLGSVAESVLKNASCPALVVKLPKED
jgi:nucleotide-binding universal stress UspA family protein